MASEKSREALVICIPKDLSLKKATFQNFFILKNELLKNLTLY